VGDFAVGLLRTYGPAAGFGVVALFIFFAHLTAAPGTQVSVLFGLLSYTKRGSAGGAPAGGARSHRKILYVKVNYLSDKTSAAHPFYERVVNRLDPEDRNIAVYDEAVYYTLEMFPTRRAIEGRKDSSSGVVDSRMLVPWRPELASRDDNRDFVDLEPADDSDTLLTVSHFENGLQGRHQDFATAVPEGAEYARLVVDFSSVPGAHLFISAEKACVTTSDDREIPIGFTPCGGSIFMASHTPTGKGQKLRMYFTFDWSRAPRPPVA
jgi:hypothetical protein